MFLLGGHPALARLDGVYVRGQCEVFISLAVAAALLPLAHARRTIWRALIAGLWLGSRSGSSSTPPPMCCRSPQRPGVLVGPRSPRLAPRSPGRRHGRGLRQRGGADVASPRTTRSSRCGATVDYNLAYSSAAFTGTAGPLAISDAPAGQSRGCRSALVSRRRRCDRRADRRRARPADAARIGRGGAGVDRGADRHHDQRARSAAVSSSGGAGAVALAAAIGGRCCSRIRSARWLAMAVLAAGLWRVGVSDRPIALRRIAGSRQQRRLRPRLRARPDLARRLPRAFPRRAEMRRVRDRGARWRCWCGARRRRATASWCSGSRPAPTSSAGVRVHRGFSGAIRW